MNYFCQWLYDNYAAPMFEDEAMSESYQCQKREWLAYAQTLSNHERLLSLDLLNSMKRDWGAQAFVYGLQAGFFLALELPPNGPTSPAVL